MKNLLIGTLFNNIIKKLVVISIIVVTVIFDSCTSQGAQRKVNVQNEDSIVWKKDICPECKGTGQVKASTATRVYLGIISFGPGAMIQFEECNLCNGSGVICKRILL